MATAKHPAARGYHHGALRQALLEGALGLLSTRGVEGVTIRALARQVGVSHAAPGHHFADRAALLAALAEEGFGRLADRLEASSVAARSPRRRLEHVGQAYVRFAMEQPALFRLMFARSPTGQPSLGEAARALEALRRAVSRALPAKAGARRREETTLTAWALVHGLAVLWLDGPAAALLANPAAFEAKVARVLRSAVQAYAGPQA